MNDPREYVEDTIVAQATPPGVGGVAIVRLSGPETEAIAERMLGCLPAPRMATLARIRNAAGDLLDTGIAIHFPGPRSFTGESVLELHCHGGPQVVAMLIEAAVQLGARHATPGEFSKRAFLNDKLDLVQAEAIADLVESGTTQAARAALRSMSGEFSDAIHELEARLTELRLHVEAAIDFPEEEIDFLSDGALIERIARCAEAISAIRRAAAVGRVLRDGYQLVIVGRPNAGKSSLLNRLAGEEAAIVTEVAGTTRDVLRERIEIDGLGVELVDTAGLRHDPDLIEAEGIRRAREALRKADAALWIQDASEPDVGTMADLEDEIPAGLPVVIVHNKIDRTGDAPGVVDEAGRVVNISAQTGAGVDDLRAVIARLAGYRDLGEGAFTARRRHVEALERAAGHFEQGRRAMEEERAGEIFAEELRLAQQSLGEITGGVTSDELLGRIFSSFCIGK